MNTLDLFGTNFNFTTFGEKKFHTVIGFILSCLYYSLIIVCTVVFGQDLFLRINPKIISEQVRPENSTIYTPNKTNFTYAWRLDDDNNNKVDFSGVLYVFLRYVEYEWSNETKALEVSRKIALPIESCTQENAPDLKFQKDLSLSDWNCINFEKYNLTMGGDWLKKYMGYIYIHVGFCDSEFNLKNFTNCSSKEKVYSFMNNNSMYFSVATPDFYFDANNIKTPLQYQYKYTYNYISSSLYRSHRHFLKTIYLDDDQDLLFSGSKHSNQTALDGTKMEIDLISDSEYQNPIAPFIYTEILYLNSGGEKFTRRYMKIQDLAATVGGTMGIIYQLFKILSTKFNAFHRNISLYNEIFSFDEAEVSRETSTSSVFELDRQNKLTSKQEKIEIITLHTRNRDYREEELKNSKDSNLSSKNNISANNILDNELELYKYPPGRENEIMEKLKKQEEYTKKKEKFYPSFKTFVKNFFCKSKLEQKELSELKSYEVAKAYIMSKLDIVTYIQMNITLEKLLGFKFNEYQSLAIRNAKKKNLLWVDSKKNVISTILNTEVNFDEESNIAKSLEENIQTKLQQKMLLIKYFIHKMKNTRTLNREDESLFKSLDDTLRQIIIEEISR